jgi:hypothetical protein
VANALSNSNLPTSCRFEVMTIKLKTNMSM